MRSVKLEIAVQNSKLVSVWGVNIWRNDLLGGVGALGVFLVTRLVNLTRLPVFVDEAIYIRWAQVMRAEASLRFLPLSDGKQPLYMWLVIPALKVVNNPLVAGRWVSVGAGFLSLIGIFLLTLQLTRSRTSAWWAALGYAVVPYAVFFDRMALVDSLLAGFFIWSLLLGILAMERRRWDFSMLCGFALGGALLTKSPGVFLWGLLPLGVAAGESRFGGWWSSVREWLGKWVYLVPAYMIGWGMYNILRLGPEFHMLARRNQDYVYPWREVLAHPFYPLVSHLGEVGSYFWSMLTPGGVMLGLIGLMGLIKRKRFGVLGFLGGWFLIPLVVQAAIARTMTARYVLFLTLPVIVCAAVGWEWLRERCEVRMRVLAIVLVLGFLIPAFWFDYWLVVSPERVSLPRTERSGYLEEWTAGQGIVEIAELVKERAKGGRVLVGSEGWFGTPFSGLEMYLNRVPGVTVIGVGYPVTGVSEKLTNALGDNRVYLVVNRSRFLIEDPGGVGLKLVAEYPKAERPDGTRDALMLWEVGRI